VDQVDFEFRYTVSGNSNCSASQFTDIKISVVRQVNSGIPENINLCESDIFNGVYDIDIDLSDDRYLKDEDIEGFWLFEADGTKQLTTIDDSTINLKQVYENIENIPKKDLTPLYFLTATE